MFRPIFDEIEKLSGKKYGSTLPTSDRGAHAPSRAAVGASPTASGGAPDATPEAGVLPRPEQEKIDIAFRVIADHIRTLSFAIADGIQPSNEGRGYVLRRILRRAVRYGRTLGFHEPFFYKLVDVVAQSLGDVFPEVRNEQARIRETIKREEEAFNKTLDMGMAIFEEIVAWREFAKELLHTSLNPPDNDGDFKKWLSEIAYDIEGGSDLPLRSEEWQFLLKLRAIARTSDIGSVSQKGSQQLRTALASITQDIEGLLANRVVPPALGIRALRHVRLSARPHGTYGARTRADC